jgi:soluble lytic murein transglycosylase
MFPNGEKIDSAHLNIIDALREAGKYDEAGRWVDKAVETFKTTPTEMNALHARLRMEIFRENWKDAIKAADALLALNSFKGSMSSADEVRYLKAIATERSGNKVAAKGLFSSMPAVSYFGSLATSRVAGSDNSTVVANPADYPVPFRETLLKEAGKRKIDPRFLLAIMKQESVFKAGAKSPAGARGLLQLVYDTAIKYKDKAGYPALQPDDLYNSTTNIAIGSEYVAALLEEFSGMNEAIAASYNGGEDNALRWLNRTKLRDPGIFTSEIGFAETKAYVQKVMNNYRAYKSLYTESLTRK